MSEFLWRGYNVAVPAVDVGEDVFVVDPGDGVLRRVQVKTAGTGTRHKGTKTVQFKLSRSQLNLSLGGSALFFMLVARWDDVEPQKPWRFILIRSDQLNELRAKPASGRRGRPKKADPDAGDQLIMQVTLSASDAEVWGHSLGRYLDRWSKDDWDWAGPMKTRISAAINATGASKGEGAESLAPSPDPEMT